MEDRLRGAGALDGVYIVSHGAMRATGDTDPDGRLYRMVRDVVGTGIRTLTSANVRRSRRG